MKSSGEEYKQRERPRQSLGALESSSRHGSAGKGSALWGKLESGISQKESEEIQGEIGQLAWMLLKGQVREQKWPLGLEVWGSPVNSFKRNSGYGSTVEKDWGVNEVRKQKWLCTQRQRIVRLRGCFWFSLSFFFFKLWKFDNTFTEDLENTEQNYT